MRQYEAIFVFHPKEEKFTSAQEFIEKQFEKNNIQIIKQEDMGEKKLAYEIKKNGRGHYILYIIESEANNLKKVEKPILIRPDILRFLFVRKDMQNKQGG